LLSFFFSLASKCRTWRKLLYRWRFYRKEPKTHFYFVVNSVLIPVFYKIYNRIPYYLLIFPASFKHDSDKFWWTECYFFKCCSLCHAITDSEQDCCL